MSVMFALLLAQAAEAAAPTPTREEEKEIVVMARKAAWWRGFWQNKDGVTTCATRTSTGDAEVDKILCDGLVDCAPRYIPEMEAVVRARQAAGATITPENIEKILAPVQAKIRRCARASSRGPFIALIRARKAAR